MPQAGEAGDEVVWEDGVGKENVEPEEVATWEMVTREALTEGEGRTWDEYKIEAVYVR